jgi:hypothetical protein
MDFSLNTTKKCLDKKTMFGIMTSGYKIYFLFEIRFGKENEGKAFSHFKLFFLQQIKDRASGHHRIFERSFEAGQAFLFRLDGQENIGNQDGFNVNTSP